VSRINNSSAILPGYRVKVEKFNILRPNTSDLDPSAGYAMNQVYEFTKNLADTDSNKN
jgi:hypothetical protein